MSRSRSAQAVSRDRLWELYWSNPREDQVFQDLIATYEPYVASIAWKFCPSAEQFQDYKQEGLVGLIEAIQRFRQEKVTHFLTFATFRIVGSIKDYQRSQGWGLRLTRTEQRAIMRLRQAEDRFFDDHGRLPTNDQELADAYDLPLVDVLTTRAIQASTKLMSLDAPASSDEDETVPLGDILADRVTDPLGAFEFSDLKPIFDRLSRNEKIVLAMNVLDTVTCKEIAGRLGISEARVSQIKTQALEILRQGLSLSPRARQLFQVFLEDRQEQSAKTQKPIPEGTIDLVEVLARLGLSVTQTEEVEQPMPFKKVAGEVNCRATAFTIAMLLWRKIRPGTTAIIDYEVLFKEAGLPRPENDHIIYQSIGRLEEEKVVQRAGARMSFRRGSVKKLKFIGEEIIPIPKLAPTLRLVPNTVYDLDELMQLFENALEAKPAPPPVPALASPSPKPPPIEEKGAVHPVAPAASTVPPSVNGNGKSHTIVALDYTPEALRAKAEGLRAQAQQLIQQAETLEEAARIKETFDRAKAIMEGA